MLRRINNNTINTIGIQQIFLGHGELEHNTKQHSECYNPEYDPHHNKMPRTASESSLLLVLAGNWRHFLRFSHGQFAGRPVLSHDEPVAAGPDLGVAEAGHAGVQGPPVQLHVVVGSPGVVRVAELVVGGGRGGAARLGELGHTAGPADCGGPGYH